MDRSHDNDQNDDGENGYEEEPDFNDPEGYVDNITDEGKCGKFKFDSTYGLCVSLTLSL